MYQRKHFYKIRLYIYFLIYVVIFIKFSTSFVNAETYKISKIELTKPYELNFNIQIVIENAFRIGFLELVKKITISDEKSTNGIFVNGELTTESKLESGYRIQIGKFNLIITKVEK